MAMLLRRHSNYPSGIEAAAPQVSAGTEEPVVPVTTPSEPVTQLDRIEDEIEAILAKQTTK